MERPRGPIVIDNRNIPTSMGIVDVEVDQEAFREYMIRSACLFEDDEPEALAKIDSLVIAFGKRSYRDVLADNFQNQFLSDGETQKNAARMGKIAATAISSFETLIDMGVPHRAGFMATDKNPFLYFNLPNILFGDSEGTFNGFYKTWTHELKHFSDYLNPQDRIKMMRDQYRMWIATGVTSLFSFALYEKTMVEYLLSLDNPLSEAISIVPFTGFALAMGFCVGNLTRMGYYYLFHQGEKNARAAGRDEDQSEIRELVKITVN